MAYIVVCAFTALGAYSAIVENYSEIEVQYQTSSGPATGTYDVDISTGYSWSLMLVACICGVGEFLLSLASVYFGKEHLQNMPGAFSAVI